MPIIVGIALVVVILQGSYTFYNAKGFSYLSSDSKACNNCHVMNDVYSDWLKSPHAKHAKCIDCHLPHDFVGKWMAKAKSGVGHAYEFTFNDNLPPNLSASENTKKVVQANCIACHMPYASNAVNPTLKNHPNNGDALNCVSCHAGMGHKRGF
ncbi:cytochrome c nitrite reductase small subunit [Helicobacter sp. 13S00401-1]|uniref:cytochrome c nitrite reductase small subunit n=1 Tax=Helicobacter sp. 13S00401-1 TaxID=1905758 RepID=UPI000BA4F0DB|nr:cytochrome c nitrite reductase small subunit [Helicobacter sp. 13S00401-1]PAF49733.1 cytochrome c nitrite reductase small subunit [Helicobacter sp. 13S00401-1]